VQSRSTMRFLLSSVAVFVVSTHAASAFADPPASSSPSSPESESTAPKPETPDSGFSFGARVGYGIPLGSATGAPGDDLDKVYSGALPLVLDVGYRVTPNVYFGLYGQYGFGIVASNPGCSNGVTCTGTSTRFGLNVHYHFQPKETADPWIGGGIGYEWASVDLSGPGGQGSISMSGWELFNLQMGIDFRASPLVRIGPFVALSAAEYTDASATINSQNRSGSVSNQALHEWLTLGIRTQFDL